MGMMMSVVENPFRKDRGRLYKNRGFCCSLVLLVTRDEVERSSVC